MDLAIRTLKSAIVGLLVLAAVIFVPAGTLAYWQGWAFLVVFTLSTNIIGIYLALRNPALLERRIKAGPGAETRPAQKVIITLAFAGAIALVIVSVLDYRFGWSHVPAWISVFGNFHLLDRGSAVAVLAEDQEIDHQAECHEARPSSPPAPTHWCGIPCMSAC
ncbi:hypothetical protein [Mesorhizobium helmanticense]|uniref:hypothetical protein n=1 Tax=Mesorhizobium helmanticense TaxID=1776423 RepID=UPI001FE06B0F|nr:hypothetical protein [Mesorhizobium helmanticense]